MPNPLEQKPLSLNYSGDLRGEIEGQIVGPNIFGERFTIKSTTYDPKTDKTNARVRFATWDDIRGAK